MADLTDALMTRLPPAVHYLAATVATSEPCTITIGGDTVEAINVTSSMLRSGERVLTQSVDGSVWVTHILTPRPQTGAVTGISGGKATVSAGQETITDVPIAGAAPRVGDRIVLLWGTEGAVGITLADPPAPPPPTPPPAPSEAPAAPAVPGAAVAAAVSAGTARSGKWRTDGTARHRPYQGNYAGGANSAGYWFYGGALRSEGTATGCTIRLSRPRSAGIAARVPFRLHSHTADTRPGSPPTLTPLGITAELAWGETRVIDLGARIGQQLLDGTIAGIGISTSVRSEYGSLNGPADDALSGQIKIPYTRRP